MDLNNRILMYISKDFFKKCLLITGHFGVGKTTLLQKFITNYQALTIHEKQVGVVLKYTHYCIINSSLIKEDFNFKKHIVENSHCILSKKLDPIIDNVIDKTLHNVTKAPKPLIHLLNSFKDNVEFSKKTDSSDYSIKIFDIISKFYNSRLNYVYDEADFSKCIIIIDDIDRCYTSKSSIKKIFLKIIDFMSFSKCKIICVMSKDNLTKKDNKLVQLWFEKLFDFEINIERHKPNNFVPSLFSTEFQNLIRLNPTLFFNYRSLEKYNNLESIIDNNYKHLYSDNKYLSTITVVKEHLYYMIFFFDNMKNFKTHKRKEEEHISSSKNSDYLLEKLFYGPEWLKDIYGHYSINDDILEPINIFIKTLDTNDIFNCIDNQLYRYNGQLGDINKEYEKYLISSRLFHIDGHINSIKDPQTFIFNFIKKYESYLLIDVVDLNQYTLLFWILKAIKLNIDEKRLDILFAILKSNFEKHYINKSKSIDDIGKLYIINYFKFTFLTYKQELKGYPVFLNELNDIIIDFKNRTDPIIFKNISICNDSQLIEYCIDNCNDFLKNIMMQTTNPIQDLIAIRRINIEKYEYIRDIYLNSKIIDHNEIITLNLFKIANSKLPDPDDFDFSEHDDPDDFYFAK